MEDDLARQEIQEKRDLKEKEQEQQTSENLKWEHGRYFWFPQYDKNVFFKIFIADFAANVELTEEEQIALLEQYENEQKRRSFAPKKPNNNSQTIDDVKPSDESSEEKTGMSSWVSIWFLILLFFDFSNHFYRQQNSG